MNKEITDLAQQLDAVADSQRVLVELQVEMVRFLQSFQKEQRAAFAVLQGTTAAAPTRVAAPVIQQPGETVAPVRGPAAAAPAGDNGLAFWSPPSQTAASPATESPQSVPAVWPVAKTAQPAGPLGIDFVVPVYNALHHARLCIESVLRHATKPYTLTVVDDCSDSHTRAELDRMVAHHVGAGQADIRVIRHATNAGYLSSVNEAIEATGSPICVLLNSDAILSPDACERLRAGFASDARIGIITAVSTWANWTKIPFPAGSNYLDLQDYIAKNEVGTDAIADIGNASGFFFAVRRALFAELGLFDRSYHPGYWEEADFCMLAMKAGYRVTVDLGLYIYHHGWGSFEKSGRDVHMERNRHVFMARWRRPFAELERRWRNGNPAAPLMEHIGCASRHRAGTQPRVLFVSPKGDTTDDSVTLVQLVNALVNRGISANIFYAGPINERLFDMTPMYFRPLTGRPQVEDLLSYDIYVATSEVAAAAVGKLAASAKTVAGNPAAAFGFAFNAAERLPGMRAILRGTGAGAAPSDVVALPGVNLDIFYPRDGARDTHILSRVSDAAWARHADAIAAFHERLAQTHPHLAVAIMGSEAIRSRLPSVRHNEEPHRMTNRAELLSRSLLVIDWDGAAGGRLAFLETAACGGVPVILMDGDAAIDMEHCVVAGRNDVNALVERLAGLAEKPNDVAALAAKARELALANALASEADHLAAAFHQTVELEESAPAANGQGADLLTLRAS